MLLLLALACVPPSTFGIRSDGSVGPKGTAEIGFGTGTSATIEMDPGDTIAGLAVNGSYAVADRAATEVTLARVGGFWVLELGARTRLSPDEEGLTVTTLEDLSVLVGDLDSKPVWGGRLGAVGSYGTGGPWRPYLGATVNPSLMVDQLWWYSNLGLGVSLRGTAGDHLGTVVQAEFDYNRDWTDEVNAFGLILMAGVTLP